MLFLKKYNTIFSLLLIIAISFFVGFSFGNNSSSGIESVYGLENKQLGMPNDVSDFSSFWRVWNVINDKFVPVYTDEVASNDERTYGAIQGLAASLGDPYTVFFPPVESEDFESTIRGNFGGVGMEVGIRDGILTVIAPLKDTPAERSGILAGDKVIAIDNVPSQGLSIDDAVQKIRGEIGTRVTLTILREDMDPFEISVVRDTINIPTLDTNLRGDGIFVISLYNFSAPSADLFRGALREFVEYGSDKLILDLRGNPGGFLESAIDISSWFLKIGQVVVTEDFGGNKENVDHRSKGYNIFNDNLKFVILIDGGSASASEIVAGALREHKKATLIGKTTFGKGSVQELVEITPDTSFKVTVARWLTPDGNSISKNGVAPDIEVDYTKEDREAERDPQMDKAVEFLLGR